MEGFFIHDSSPSRLLSSLAQPVFLLVTAPTLFPLIFQCRNSAYSYYYAQVNPDSQLAKAVQGDVRSISKAEFCKTMWIPRREFGVVYMTNC